MMSSQIPQTEFLAPLPAPAWRRHLRDPDVWHVAIVALLLLVASLGAVWLWFLYRAWRVAHTASCELSGRHCLLVFGKRLVDGRADADLRARIARAGNLIRNGNAHTLVLLGGRVGTEPSEAEVACALLQAQGLPDDLPVLLEQISGDTLENLRHARGLLDSHHRGPVVLLSNRYHLARCSLLARTVGLEHLCCAAETRWVADTRHVLLLIKEAGLAFLLDIGIRWARLIGHRRMLSKLR
jgi:uncharacterized SAM-binding protein YcdF (DUF218 family)